MEKKSKGRQPTARGSVHGIQVAARLNADELAVLDGWIAEQMRRYGVEFSRADAIRALIMKEKARR